MARSGAVGFLLPFFGLRSGGRAFWSESMKGDLGVSHNKGTLFWGPYNKDPTIWGTILGSPLFGNPHLGV